MALHKVKKLSPVRYESYIKSDPPMALSDVLQSMRDFVGYVDIVSLWLLAVHGSIYILAVDFCVHWIHIHLYVCIYFIDQ